MALYRKYRPERFQDVIGQDHVTRPLMAALRANRTVHAYLFSGPRGCGKTTSARILARCLNCAQGPTDTPCGQCASCRDLALDGAGSLDVVEMDAASHGGVDDARDLVERAAFAPVRDRYKIFIIDEAHMVTTQGFNALLKLVEEPPAHIKFVFATTEPEKVIGTIRSRTHHYPFRLVAPDTMEKYLAGICAQEGFTPGPGVLGLVVRAGGGSVRDSMSVLDQLMGGSESSTLEYEQAIALLGYTDSAMLDRTVAAVAAEDGGKLFATVEELIGAGHEPRRFVADLLQRFRDLVVISLAGEAAPDALGSLPQDRYEQMVAQAQALGAARATYSAEQTNEALSHMTGATSPRLQLELLCARLLLPAYQKHGGAVNGAGFGGGGFTDDAGARAALSQAGDQPGTAPVRPAAAGGKSARDVARERVMAAARQASVQQGTAQRGPAAPAPAESTAAPVAPAPAAPAASQSAGVATPARAGAAPAEAANEPHEEAENKPREEAESKPREEPDFVRVLQDQWQAVTTSGAFAQGIFAEPARPVSQDGNTVTIAFAGERGLQLLENPRNLERLNKHLSIFTNKVVGQNITARPVPEAQLAEGDDARPKAEPAFAGAKNIAQSPAGSETPPLPEEISDEEEEYPEEEVPFYMQRMPMPRFPAEMQAAAGPSQAGANVAATPDGAATPSPAPEVPGVPETPESPAPAPAPAPGPTFRIPTMPKTHQNPQGPGFSAVQAVREMQSGQRAPGVAPGMPSAASNAPAPMSPATPARTPGADQIGAGAPAAGGSPVAGEAAAAGISAAGTPVAGVAAAGSPVTGSSAPVKSELSPGSMGRPGSLGAGQTASSPSGATGTFASAAAYAGAAANRAGNSLDPASATPAPGSPSWLDEESVSADDPKISESSVVGVDVVLETFEAQIIEEITESEESGY
ncbi:DNA polymerase III subunit gamma and tau [Actinobaculum suis]|uniref:DNA polymerase III subunit gamma and tau n=1 Tax=Actinobaculum suis TaxID=1657 RepID=UPI000A4BDD84|nr:DNA polymerase III subunit gamma and tau [Actinobaculum suis]